MPCPNKPLARKNANCLSKNEFFFWTLKCIRSWLLLLPTKLVDVGHTPCRFAVSSHRFVVLDLFPRRSTRGLQRVAAHGTATTLCRANDEQRDTSSGVREQAWPRLATPAGNTPPPHEDARICDKHQPNFEVTTPITKTLWAPTDLGSSSKKGNNQLSQRWSYAFAPQGFKYWRKKMRQYGPTRSRSEIPEMSKIDHWNLCGRKWGIMMWYSVVPISSYIGFFCSEIWDQHRLRPRLSITLWTPPYVLDSWTVIPENTHTTAKMEIQQLHSLKLT